MTADVEVIMHDSAVVKVKGSNHAYVSKGALYLAFWTENKREVTESMFWGLWRWIKIIDDSKTTTTAIFAKNTWTYFRIVAVDKAEPVTEAQ
jgi:hypothetical protein